jgi:hypothetical protein
MLKQRRELAQEVADSLFEAERAIDLAIQRTAHLVGLIPAVRNDANLSALVGQGAIRKAIASVGALGEAREGIVEAHKELSIAQAQIGLGAVTLSGAVPKPDDPAFARDLRPVTTAKAAPRAA